MYVTLPEGGLVEVRHKITRSKLGEADKESWITADFPDLKEKDDGILTSIALVIDSNGNLQLNRSKISLGSLLDKLNERYPEHDHNTETIIPARWVDELLNDVQLQIEKEFKVDEGLRVQKQSMSAESRRSKEEFGDNQDVSESEGSRRLY